MVVFFKQKTAYEMRISDWSSDVCSSDLPKDIFLTLLENHTRPDGSDVGPVLNELFNILETPEKQRPAGTSAQLDAFPYVDGTLLRGRIREDGRASCRERVCPSV